MRARKTADANTARTGMQIPGRAARDSKESDLGLYKGEAGRAQAFRSYDRAMELWSVSFKDDWVDTTYGRTHIAVAGPEDGKPLFLLPGLFADATLWYANASDLSRGYRMYALDMINYGGKSEPSGKTVSGIEDYAGWFGEILDRYGYEAAAVAGLSYGSWLTLALARELPTRVAVAILLDPSETFIPMDGGIAWRGFWTFAVFPNRAKYRAFFEWMGGGYSDPRMDLWFEHMLDVIEFGRTRMDQVPRHRTYRPEELEAVTQPVLVLAGGKPILYKDLDRFAAAARAALPNAEVEIVPDTGHGLNMEKPGIVNDRILAFLAERYR